MKYREATINGVAARTGLMPLAIRAILEAFESTDEQKALRVDAERYRHLRGFFGIAVPDDDGSLIWLPVEIDDAIDKARQQTIEGGNG